MLVSIYLGLSLIATRNLRWGLVLSLTTVMTSPQFHVDYDETFKTVRRKDARIVPPSVAMAIHPLALLSGENGVGLAR